MILSELFASASASILITAFNFNRKKIMSTESNRYRSLNFTGSALCGYSTCIIRLYPFVFLNCVWANADKFSLFKHVPRGTIIK